MAGEEGAMGEPRKLDGPSTLPAAPARARSRKLLLTVVGMLAWPAVVPAAVTVTASQTETLYSTSNPDCATLHALSDDALPLNIVRLKANVPGVPDDQVTFRWS